MITKTKNNCDKACDILRLTNDGNYLANEHLSLLEAAVNGFLTEKGQAAFDKLHDTVLQGKYKKPAFHGIPDLTIDQVGYVYWKNQRIEHYTLSLAYSQEAKKQAEELARRCKILEAQGKPVNTRTVVWQWQDNNAG